MKGEKYTILEVEGEKRINYIRKRMRFAKEQMSDISVDFRVNF